MRALLVLVLFLLALAAALANGHWLLFRLAYMLGAVLVLAYLWSWVNLRWLRLERRTRTRRSQVGGDAEEKFVARNTGRIPKLWLEVQDRSDMPGHHASSVISLDAGRSAVWTVRTRCRVRGQFTLGPITVTSGDPFGLFQHRRTIADTSTLIVYPRLVDLPAFAIPAGEVPRDSRYHQRTYQVTPRAAGVRDYSPGDSFNRIHWPTTARSGKLAVKEFEMDPSSDAWVLLDLQGAAQAGEGEESTEEYGATVAASLFKHLLEAKLSVGLLTHERVPRVLEPDRGERQLIKALEWLAVARASGSWPLIEVITAESFRFSRHSTLIVITPSTDERWVMGLQHLLSRGVRVVAIVLDIGTFGVADTPLLVVGSLAAVGIPTYLVRRGEDLGLALGQLT